MPCSRILVLARIRRPWRQELCENCPIPGHACLSLPGGSENPHEKAQMNRKAQGPSCIALGSCPEVLPEINLTSICMRNECGQETHDCIIQPSYGKLACTRHWTELTAQDSRALAQPGVNMASEMSTQSTLPPKTPQSTQKL